MGSDPVNEFGSAGAGQPDDAERDRCLLEFLKILRLTFKMASIYHQDHPTFKRTVEELLTALEKVFQFYSPLVIGFTPNSLLIGEQFWGGDKTTLELARLFHLRKVKKLEIYRGLSAEEFLRFISRLTRPIQEFIRQGGIQALLNQENFAHLRVEVLDYSQLLQGEGDEIKDIWPYLLMEAVTENDRNKLDQLAGTFEKVVGRFNTEDLIQNEELHKNFIRFFQHLRETAQEKYNECAKELLKALIAARKIPPDSKLENLKQIISSLSERDLASTIWEELLNNDKFDTMSFSVFARIIDGDRHRTVATSLKELFTSDDPRNRRPEVERKIKSLLQGTSRQLLSDIYRQTLASLLTEISFEKQITFDREQLKRNYRFILLNLFFQEQQKEAACQRLDRIMEEWPAVVEDMDLEFIKILLTLLQEKAALLEGEANFEKIRTSLAKSVEDFILRGESQPELDTILSMLPKSVNSPDIYLMKIFLEKQVTSVVLKAFFQFFPDQMPAFFQQLRRKAADSFLLGKMVAALQMIDLPVSLTVLKEIFKLGDNSIKLQVLKAMEHLSEFDESFLFPILNSKDRQLKAEALSLLMRYERTRHVAFIRLFNIPSPYGIRNRKIIQNIQIVEEKNIREARPFLLKLASRKDFWNRRVRQEARRVLEKWDER